MIAVINVCCFVYIVVHLKSRVNLASVILWRSCFFFFLLFSTSIHLSSRQKELVVRLSSVLEPSPVMLVWWCPSGRLGISGRLGVRLVCPLTTVDLVREVLILTLWWLQDGRGSNQALKWLLLFCFTVSSLYLCCGCILQNSRSRANTLGKVKCFSSMPFFRLLQNSP